MEEEAFSAEDSLQVIQAMINKAKETAADNSYYFLLWGWLVFFACIGQFVLKVIVQSPYHPWVWSINIVGVVLSAIHGAKEARKVKVKNYVDEAIDYLWMGILAAYIFFAFAFARIGWENCFAFYMLLYGVGSFITGKLLKFTPLVWGALASWVLAIVSLYTSFDVSMLVSAAAIMVSYIIPGYLLRLKHKSQ